MPERDGGKVPTLEEIRQTLRPRLAALTGTYCVKSLGIYGPYAIGQAQPGNEVGVLVEYYRKPGLFKFVELENELTEILGVKVHLSTLDGFGPEIASHINSELAPV